MTASFAAGPAPSFRLDVDGPVTALVTGAGGGIGARVALGLAEYGADVACLDVAADGCRRTVAAIEGVGRRAIALDADVAHPDAMTEAVRRTEAELGPLRHARTCSSTVGRSPGRAQAALSARRASRSNVAASPSASTTGR